MESLNWEETLIFIKKAADERLKENRDEISIKSLLESAKILADFLLKLKTADVEILTAGAQVATNVYEAARSLNVLIIQIRKSDSPTSFKNKYEEFKRFIKEIKCETKIIIEDIEMAIQKIKEKVSAMPLKFQPNKFEDDELKAFIKGVSFDASMIDIDIQNCKRKVEFVLKNIEEFIESVKDVNDKDKMSLFRKGIADVGVSGVVSCVAGAVASIALLPALPVAIIAGGVASLSLGAGHYYKYQGRSDERTKFEDEYLKAEKRDFDYMKSNLKGFETKLTALVENAKKF